jgi:hypothetical protein
VSLTGRTAIEQALAALGTQLELAEHAPIDIVVIGGAALNVLGFVARPTRDVDVLSLTEIDPSGMGHMLVKCSPLSDALLDADTGVGRHTQDLAALQPTGTELLAGARWARTQDPSDGFKTMLMALLRFMGADDQAEELSDDA